MTLNQAKNIHFIGIGGIGMSGLAFLLKNQGKSISGSDLVASKITQNLASLGVKVFIGHEKKNIFSKIQLIVKSLAIPEKNPEILAVRKLGITVLSYAEALGQFGRDKYNIAVSGMHGKTTTTAMIGELLERARFDPTVLVGSLVKRWESNARAGQSNYFVFEADEYERAFLHYQPDILVLTRVEEDHLDTYKNLADILKTFIQYTKKLSQTGVLIANSDDKNINKIISQSQVRVVTYGINSGDYRAEAIKETEEVTSFMVKTKKSVSIKEINFELKIPGIHNVYNALATLVVSQELKIDLALTRSSLLEFSGTWRRFEKIGEYQGRPVISDYGHHPTEIQATLSAARVKYPDQRIVLVYQPHQHNRTKNLFKAFIK